MVSFGIAMIFIKIVVVLVLQYQQQADQASQQEPDYTSKYDPIWHNGSDTFGPTVVLVSLDGFRAEYLQRDLTPNMLEFGTKKPSALSIIIFVPRLTTILVARTGVRAEYMHPAFPASIDGHIRYISVANNSAYFYADAYISKPLDAGDRPPPRITWNCRQ